MLDVVKAEYLLLNAKCVGPVDDRCHACPCAACGHVCATNAEGGVPHSMPMAFGRPARLSTMHSHGACSAMADLMRWHGSDQMERSTARIGSDAWWRNGGKSSFK